MSTRLHDVRGIVEEWCNAFHGNHDEHQCHLKPGHEKRIGPYIDMKHQCYCGVWW